MPPIDDGQTQANKAQDNVAQISEFSQAALARANPEQSPGGLSGRGRSRKLGRHGVQKAIQKGREGPHNFVSLDACDQTTPIGDLFSYKNLVKVEMSFVPLIQINEWGDLSMKKYSRSKSASRPAKKTTSNHK